MKKTTSSNIDNSFEYDICSCSVLWNTKVFESGEVTMTMHSSLKSAVKIKEKRNVLKRFERIELLKKRGKWEEGNRGVGLPKTKPEE